MMQNHCKNNTMDWSKGPCLAPLNLNGLIMAVSSQGTVAVGAAALVLLEAALPGHQSGLLAPKPGLVFQVALSFFFLISEGVFLPLSCLFWAPLSFGHAHPMAQLRL